jgi:hypothetical protein
MTMRTTGFSARQTNEQGRLLHRLIQGQGLTEGEYALFFVSDEGQSLPVGPTEGCVEEASGYVLDKTGRVFSFWLGWDPGLEEGAFTAWREVDPEPHWSTDPEYRRARKRVGLLR